MPEPYWPKKKNSYRISDAMKRFELASIRCRYCKTERHYELADLKIIFGDVEVDDVTFVQKWRCTGCGHNDTLKLDIVNLTAAERQEKKIRRLDRIDYVRRVIWRDE